MKKYDFSTTGKFKKIHTQNDGGVDMIWMDGPNIIMELDKVKDHMDCIQRKCTYTLYWNESNGDWKIVLMDGFELTPDM